ncbi:modular serine protease-like [Mytilus californianus]|uniref:modular serine protease-like n=1 Tax=Mytilus californianus TaxID=6549 RepID=UPI0022481918|nr:modular serine protease-like [Mytilus californianus]XP_052073744.1 modular serine protease-like [Mytilus californianus]
MSITKAAVIVCLLGIVKSQIGRPCSSWQVHCADQIQCIYDWEQCDGETVHCRDGSDEQEDICRNHTCPSTDLKCADDLQCFSYLYLCNGRRDCYDGSDETFNICKTKECAFRQRYCDNGNCVYITEFCNGKDDCGDNSDEKEHCFRNNH